MSWKDFFYFQKQDKLAIILLLILIAISGGIYIATIPSTQEETMNHYEPKQQKEASSTKANLISENVKDPYNSPKAVDQYPIKLKAGETVELNEADTSALKRIPGIGSGYSNRIAKYRALLGGYTNINQLREVWGIDEDLYIKIIPYLTLNAHNKKIKINSSDFNTLNKHPYIDYKQAKVILDIRDRKGRIESIERLALLEEFTEADIKRLTPYLSFD